MVESLSAQEIEDQIGLRKVRFQQVIADIRTVLKADMEAFVVRETKKAFLARPEVAESMPAEMDRRADKMLEKRRWMLARQAA